MLSRCGSRSTALIFASFRPAPNEFSHTDRIDFVDAVWPDSELLLRLQRADDVASAIAGLRRTKTLSQCLTGLLEQKGLKRPQVIAAARINGTFGYQIFVGQRHASRNKLIALCIALETTVEEANAVLRSGGVNELYGGDRRDAVIIYGLMRGHTLEEIEQNLFRFRLPTIV